MTDNLEVGSSIYVTKGGELRVDPQLVIAVGDRVARNGQQRPPDHRRWLLNSSSALVACCYIDALGKVLSRGKKSGKNPNLARFKRFVVVHMRDFVAECSRKGGKHSISNLYKTYR